MNDDDVPRILFKSWTNALALHFKIAIRDEVGAPVSALLVPIATSIELRPI